MKNRILVGETLSDKLDKAIEDYNIDKDTRNNLSGKQQRVFIASQMTSDDILGNKRLDGEDFEEYRERRKIEKMWDKMVSEGKFAWVAVDMTQEPQTGMWLNNGGGTYRKEVHGELEHKKNKIEKIKKRRVSKAIKHIKKATGRD